jgi:hypothetical protein
MMLRGELWLGQNWSGVKSNDFQNLYVFLSSAISLFSNPFESACCLELILQNEIQYGYFLNV